MAAFRLPLLMTATLALAGVANLAHAESAAKQAGSPAVAPEINSRDAFQLNQRQSSKALELDGKSHWGLKLDLQQPVTREMQLKDIEAGAFYKVTPSIRVGGAVGLVDTKPASPEADTTGAVTPRMKVGASLKF